MNKSVITILSLVAFTGGFLIFYQNSPAEQKMPVTNQADQQTKQNWESKTDDQPPVTVKVTPVELSKDAGNWKFNIAFDTHSVELDQDLMQIATLMDDKGNVYKPTTWEGAGPGGHHREGILVFNIVNPIPQSVELKIKDAGGIPERLFKWNIQ